MLLLTHVFQACKSVKSGSINSSGKKYYTSFYVGESCTQYFIKPISYTNAKTKGELFLDFTFRYRNSDITKDTVNISLSIIEDSFYKSIDSIQISTKDNNESFNTDTFMFVEAKKRAYLSRFTFKSNLSKIKNLFDNNSWSIKVFYNSEILDYNCKKKTNKIINILKSKVFVFF